MCVCVFALSSVLAGDIYYWNTVTDETAWERPPELLRVSTSQETMQTLVRSIKGDVTPFELSTTPSDVAASPLVQGRGKWRKGKEGKNGGVNEGGKGEEAGWGHALGGGVKMDWEPCPEVVLDRCAEVLGMKEGAGGILAVRRESQSSPPALQFTCFTGTRVQILRNSRCSTRVLEFVRACLHCCLLGSSPYCLFGVLVSACTPHTHTRARARAHTHTHTHTAPSDW